MHIATSAFLMWILRLNFSSSGSCGKGLLPDEPSCQVLVAIVLLKSTLIYVYAYIGIWGRDVGVEVNICLSVHMCAGQRKSYGFQLSLSSMCVFHIKLRLSGLVASILFHLWKSCWSLIDDFN